MNKKQALYVMAVGAFAWLLLSLCYWMYYGGSFSQQFWGVGLALAVGLGIVGAMFGVFEAFIKGYERLEKRRS